MAERWCWYYGVSADWPVGQDARTASEDLGWAAGLGGRGSRQAHSGDYTGRGARVEATTYCNASLTEREAIELAGRAADLARANGWRDVHPEFGAYKI